MREYTRGYSVRSVLLKIILINKMIAKHMLFFCIEKAFSID